MKLNRFLRNNIFLLFAAAAGLISANVVASEDLAAAATNPIANLIQFQIQEQYTTVGLHGMAYLDRWLDQLGPGQGGCGNDFLSTGPGQTL